MTAKIDSLTKQLEKQRELTNKHRETASTQKALNDQTSDQLSRTEREVS